MEISHTHPVLWEFSDKQSEIYFKGHCDDVDKLFSNLYKLHTSLFGNLLPIENTLNNMYDFNKLIEAENGLLAKGPQKLMNLYGNILEQHNLTYSRIGDKVPTYWDGEKHVTETGNAKVLFIDDSYVIADDFQFI